jgi:hypothetical protein
MVLFEKLEMHRAFDRETSRKTSLGRPRHRCENDIIGVEMCSIKVKAIFKCLRISS